MMEGKSWHGDFPNIYFIPSADNTCDLLAGETFTASDRGVFA